MRIKVLTAILISTILAAVGGYWFGKQSASVHPDATSQTEIFLEYKPVEAMGITEVEQKKIEKLVETFEGYKFQKDSDRLLEMFTPPESKKDWDTLNFILGKDYVRGSTKPPSRLFSTQGYNHSVGGHYVRSMKKDGNSIVVEIDELRIFYTGLSEDFVGYSAEVVKMMIELKEDDNGYQIVKYYHSQPDDKFGSKYEGFIAY